MKFAVLYENTVDRRKAMMALLQQAIEKQMDLSKTPIDHPICSIRPRWPDVATLLALPLNIQCEEMSYEGKKFVTTRVLVIEAELITKSETKLDTIPSSS